MRDTGKNMRSHTILILILSAFLLPFTGCKSRSNSNEPAFVEKLLPDGLDSPDSIWIALDKIPVRLPLSMHADETRQRRELVEKLDQHMSFYKYQVYNPGSNDRDWDNRDGVNNSQETPFTRAYRKRVQKVIDEIDRMKPAENELIIWKLYSSSYLFKTPKYVFGLDISEGPTVNNKILQEELGKAFSMTARQVRELAEKVDFVFYSHHHIDHISYPFASFMIEIGSKVYGPNNPDYHNTKDLVEYYGEEGEYTDKIAKITDPWISDTARCAIADGDFYITVLNGYQDWKDQENGTPANFSYLIETDNGLGIVYFGDQRTSENHPGYPGDISEDWLLELKRLGRKIDFKIGAGPLMHIPGVENADDILRREFNPIIRIPGHEWEITHPRFGKYAHMWSGAPEDVEQVFPLTIGESFTFMNEYDIPND